MQGFFLGVKGVFNLSLTIQQNPVIGRYNEALLWYNYHVGKTNWYRRTYIDLSLRR